MPDRFESRFDDDFPCFIYESPLATQFAPCSDFHRSKSFRKFISNIELRRNRHLTGCINVAPLLIDCYSNEPFGELTSGILITRVNNYTSASIYETKKMAFGNAKEFVGLCN